MKTARLLTLNNVHGDITQHFIYVLKPLSTTVKTNMIMPTAHEGIEKISIDIILEGTAIHLHTQFIHTDDSYSQGIMFIVVNLIGFTNRADLRKASERSYGTHKSTLERIKIRCVTNFCRRLHQTVRPSYRLYSRQTTCLTRESVLPLPK